MRLLKFLQSVVLKSGEKVVRVVKNDYLCGQISGAYVIKDAIIDAFKAQE